MKEKIEMKQLQYEMQLDKARRNPDNKVGVAALFDAAIAQYELSKMTAGDASKRHMDEVWRLIREVKERAGRIGIEIDLGSFDKPAAAPAVPKAPVSRPAPQPKAADKPRDKDDFDPDSFLLKEKPGVTFDDLIDMGPSIAGVKKALDLQKKRELYPKLFEQVDASASNVLLYGPPGTGKTFFFKALANYVMTEFPGSAVFMLESGNIKSKYVGVSDQKVKALFAEARKHPFSMLCIDELENLVPDRNREGIQTHEVSLTTTFLQEMDGLKGKPENMIIVGASNVPWQIDEAMVRRMAQPIPLPLPTPKAREEYVKRNIAPKFFGADEDAAARMTRMVVDSTEHANYGNLDLIKKQIATCCLEKTITLNPDNSDVSEFVPITEEELKGILSRLVIVYDEEDIRRLDAFGKSRQDA